MIGAVKTFSILHRDRPTNKQTKTSRDEKFVKIAFCANGHAEVLRSIMIIDPSQEVVLWPFNSFCDFFFRFPSTPVSTYRISKSLKGGRALAVR